MQRLTEDATILQLLIFEETVVSGAARNPNLDMLATKGILVGRERPT